jgi:riboflavin synthase
MFTGIISDIGTIIKAEQKGDLRLTIACNFVLESIRLGDSIACNGVCLTVVECGVWNVECGNKKFASFFTVEISSETAFRSAGGMWQAGRNVNLERSLKLGDTLDGHMVSGHVDGTATIISIKPAGDSHILTLSVSGELSRFIAQKGSVTLDGVSLTVNNVVDTGFSVNIIPHTWKNTTLGERKTGDNLNLEIDIIARYVARLLNN